MAESLQVLQRLCGLALLLVTLGSSWPVSAQAVEALPEDFTVTLPRDLSRLHFYLITVDVGNQVWDNFGHTALRMVDENSATDTVFNWGLFDTSGGVVAFSFNFFKGIMDYRLGTFTPQSEFDSYRNQQRTVWQDRINLNNQEKALLYRRLMWNLQPQNISYPYQYFFDNCTTRVRDYLDEALGGQIQAATAVPTANTFRDLVVYHYRSLELIAVSLDILMNSNIDRTISAWEEMFLPSSLRARLFELPANVAQDGTRLRLLSDPEVVMAFEAPASQVDGYRVASVLLLAPVLLLFTLTRKIPVSYFSAPARISLHAPRFSFRLLGLLGVFTALFSGVYGLLMLGGWFFSGHVDLYNNWNLLLFWPTDLLGLLVAGRWLLQAKPWPLTHNTRPFIINYLLAHVLAMLFYVGVAASGYAEQSLLMPLMFILPGLLLYTVLIWIVGFQPAKPRNMFF
ncbi:MAG: hypothetical protein RLZZ385_1597 [Pseudomonadota bacterium]|jgi:hypothetical protein